MRTRQPLAVLLVSGFVATLVHATAGLATGSPDPAPGDTRPCFIQPPRWNEGDGPLPRCQVGVPTRTFVAPSS